MKRLIFDLRLTSDLGTPLRGDTLFGCLCWALRLREGEAALERALEGYTDDHPFLVLSDGMPKGFAPRPELPLPPMTATEAADPQSWLRRKTWSKRRWIPLSALAEPIRRALDRPLPPAPPEFEETLDSHNSINRLTGTTGEGQFAPFQTVRLGRPQTPEQGDGAAFLTVIAVLDEARLAAATLHQLLSDVGRAGYGRDASVGLGKFEIVDMRDADRLSVPGGGTVLTCAPCAPSPNAADVERSGWRPMTRFGRHGGPQFGGRVFKTPVLMADTGAVFGVTQTVETGFFGTGLGGRGRLSAEIPNTVHQAYAPVLALDVSGWEV